MPNPPQLVETPLAGGLQQRTADAHVPFGELTIARNCRQTKNGMLEKRPGNAKLTNQYQQPNNIGPASVDVSLGGALSSFGKQLLLTTQKGIAPYSPAFGTFNVPQPTSECALTRTNATIPQQQQGNITSVLFKMAPAVVTDGSHYFYCWVTSGGACFVTIEDISTGDIVQDQIQPQPGSTSIAWAVPLMIGTQFTVLTLDTSKNVKLAGMASPYTGLFTVNATVLAALADPAVPIDAVAVDASNFALAYSAFGASTAVVHAYTAAGASSGTLSGSFGLANIIDIRVSISNSIAWLLANSTAPKIVVKDFNVTTSASGLPAGGFQVAAAAAYTMSVLGLSATQVAVAYTFSSGGEQVTRCDVVDKTLSGGSGGFTVQAANPTYSTALASKLFQQGGKTYCWLQVYSDSGSSQNASLYGIAQQNQTQWTYVLCDTLIDSAQSSFPHPMRPLAIDAPRFAFAISQRNVTNTGASFAPLSIVSPAANQWATIFGVRASAYVSTWCRTLADFAASNRWKTVELNGNLIQSAGMVCAWDGERAFEQGFIHHICAPSYTVSVGGTLTGSKDYYYKFVPIQTDGAGNLHRGIPSTPVKATTTGTNKTIASLVAPLSLTLRAPYASSSTSTKYTVYYEVYRSQPSPGSTGTDVQTNYLDLLSATSNAFLTYTDAGAVADATSAGNANCYTFGGALPNVCPPGAKDIVAHQGRAWIIADDGDLYFSKQVVMGEAVNFSDAETSPLDVVDGIALASMDDKLIAFSRKRIYYQTGFGPGDNGLQSDYQGFVRIQSPVGCIDRRSVVSTPDGVFFQSPIGIYLLTRGLEVVYVGQPVQDELAAYPVIVSAILHPSQPWIYFYVTKADNSAGERLVYDYRVQKWYTDTLPGVPVSAASTSDGTHYWLDSTGQVWREDATTNLDNSAWVAMDVEVAPQHAAGVDGWQNLARLQVLFYSATPHDLTIQTRSGYATAYDTPADTFASTRIAAMQPFNKGATGVSAVEITPVSSKLNGISVRITDATPSGGESVGTGQGPKIFALAFETEDLKALANVDDSQRG